MEFGELEAVRALRVFGLNGSEARVYLTLARTGPATGYEVARRAGMTRANVYDALDRLRERGLVLMEAPGRGARYQAIPLAALRERHVRAVDAAVAVIEKALAGHPEVRYTAGTGTEALVAAGSAVLRRARADAHLAVDPSMARALARDLADVRRERPVTVACLGGCATPCPVCGADARRASWDTDATRLVVVGDREEVVIGEQQGAEPTYLWIRSAAVGHALADRIAAGPRLCSEHGNGR